MVARNMLIQMKYIITSKSTKKRMAGISRAASIRSKSKSPSIHVKQVVMAAKILATLLS